jgi:hypothetical protein
MVGVALGVAALMAVPATATADPGDVVEARTATSTAAVRPDGTHVLSLYTGPVQMERAGGWVPVDLTLVRGADGLVRPAAAPQDLVLTPTGPTVTFTGGGSAALDWPGPLPAPVLDGARATYPQARPGYDLVVEATSAGFVASLRTAGPAAPAATVAPLALRGRAESVPVEPAAAEGGPALTEGSAAPAGSTGTAVSSVVAAAPPASPTPVPFDTTVQTTVLRSDTSGEPDLRLGSYDGTAVARSFLTFDLAGLAGRPVTKATLALHQDWSASCRARAWEVWSSPAAGPATRWANQPVPDRLWATSSDTRGHDAACAPGWSTVDVTDLVRSWAAAGAPAGTVALRSSDETDPLSWKRFASAESGDAPHLDLVLG